MARLIDADKFGMYLADVQLANRGWRDDVCELLDDVMYALEDAPTIDAVEVVRCKDCKYNVANIDRDPLDKTDYTDVVCSYWMSDGLDEQNDFCSRGERKEE